MDQSEATRAYDPYWPPVTPRSLEGAQRTWPAGLYLLTGGAASGKSVTLMALAAYLKDTSTCPVGYLYVQEPRSSVPPGATPNGPGSEIADIVYKTIQSAGQRFLLIDSLTLVLTLWGARVLPTRENVTMKEGLRLSDVWAVAEASRAAVVAGSVVIATLNNELFPRPAALEGAAEGQLALTGTIGQVNVRNRDERVFRELRIPPRYFPTQAAFGIAEGYNI